MTRQIASSFYSLAKDEKSSKIILDELYLIESITDNFPEYIAMLDSVAVPLSDKYELIDDAFNQKLHIYTVNFIKFLSTKRLLHLFKRFIKEYENLYNKDNNIENVNIVTAIALTENEQQHILNRITQKYKKTFIPKFSVRPEIIGGIIIKFENMTVDSSIKNQLNKLKCDIL